MARGRCTFKQNDVTRALRAAEAAGREVRRVEIDGAGKIVLVIAEPADAEPGPSGADKVIVL